MRLSDAQGRDAGKYTCRATNVLGEHSQTTSISVRVIGKFVMDILKPRGHGRGGHITTVFFIKLKNSKS